MDMYERKSKKRLREEQVRVLEKSFCASKKLEPERKMRLAAELGVPARQVAVWYQNRRARFRTQSLEHDCAALHRRLDAAAAENRSLTRELHRLRHLIEKSSSESEPVHVPVSNLLDRSQDRDRDRDPQVFQFDDQDLFSFIHGCATTSSGDHDDDNMDDSFFL